MNIVRTFRHRWQSYNCTPQAPFRSLTDRTQGGSVSSSYSSGSVTVTSVTSPGDPGGQFGFSLLREFSEGHDREDSSDIISVLDSV